MNTKLIQKLSTNIMFADCIATFRNLNWRTSVPSVENSSGNESIKQKLISNTDVECDYSCSAPKCCGQFRDIRIVLFWMFFCAAIQSMTINGITNSIITTLEKRYRLSSAESGAIASIYDVGVIIAIIPLTYYGGDCRRLRLLAIGTVIMAVSCIIFVLPEWTSGRYIYGSQISTLCIRNISYSKLCEDSQTYLKNFKYVFYFGMFLFGVGASPLYTLGTTYLDENSSTENSPLYLGIYYLASLLGPSVGYIISQSFLSIYVDITLLDDGLTKESKLWVGAWWIPYILSGSLFLVAVVPLYGFPKEMPDTYKIRQKKIEDGTLQICATNDNTSMTIPFFLKNCKYLITNLPYMFVSLASALEGFLIAGFATFGPKYLETIFQIRRSYAGRYFGIVLVPSGGLGMLLGGLVVQRFRMTLPTLFKFQLAICSMGLPILAQFLIPCGNEGTHFVGVSVHYSSFGTLNTVNLTSSCNADCRCQPDSMLFKPVCEGGRYTYYSPCYAGCTTKIGKGYGKCSCALNNSSDTSPAVSTGMCKSKCRNVKYFLITIALTSFSMFFISTPSLVITLRILTDRLKTFGIGVQSIISRIFGYIPGAIVFGAMFDRACLLWNNKCGHTGDCVIYDGHELSQFTLALMIGAKTSSLLLLIAAWFSFRKSKVDNVSESQQSTNLTSTVNPAELYQ